MKNLLLSVKIFCQKNKVLLTSILIFFLVFLVLGIPYSNWWFCGSDDFLGLFQGYQTKTWGDLFYYFINGNIHQGMGPTNMVQTTTQPTFFSVYYRPLYLVYLGIQYWLFGTNAYFYLLTNVFFHAINTVILFNIFLWIIDLYPALLVSLTFAFHPQIAYRFGAIVNLHYYINVMLMLLCFLTFKKYLDTKKLKYNMHACFLFAISLFTRETSIVLPGIIFLGTCLYENKNKKIRIKSFFQNFFSILQKTAGLIFVASAFLFLRAYLYPIKFVTNTQKVGPISWLINKFPEFQVITYDFLGLSWLPWGHKTIRGIIVISLLSILLWLFIKNTKKIYVLYFLFSMLLMLWPIFFGGYCPRYFYEAQPFALMALIFLFKFYDRDFGIFKKIGICFLSILVIFYIEFAIENFLRREHKMYIHKQAVKNFLKNPEIKNRPLCFFCYPADGLGDQFASLIWTLTDDPMQILLFDTSTATVQADSNIVQTTSWRNIISDEFSENYVQIKPISGGFKFISLNSEKVFFVTEGGYSLGKKIINKEEKIKNAQVVTDFTLLIDQQYLDEKPLFIKWDYKIKKFVFLN